MIATVIPHGRIKERVWYEKATRKRRKKKKRKKKERSEMEGKRGNLGDSKNPEWAGKKNVAD